MSKFEINQVVYSTDSKELVKITNGIRDEESGELTPTEAIALRPYVEHKGKRNQIKIKLVYIGVRPDNLLLTKPESAENFDLIVDVGFN